jgi:hypothetical protein
MTLKELQQVADTLTSGQELYTQFSAGENATVYEGGTSEVKTTADFVKVKDLRRDYVFRRLFCFLEVIVDSGEDWSLGASITLKNSGRVVGEVPVSTGQNVNSSAKWRESLASLATSTLSPGADAIRLSLRYEAGFAAKLAYVNPLRITAVCDEATVSIRGSDSRVQKVRAVRAWLGVLSSNAPS